MDETYMGLVLENQNQVTYPNRQLTFKVCYFHEHLCSRNTLHHAGITTAAQSKQINMNLRKLLLSSSSYLTALL